MEEKNNQPVDKKEIEELLKEQTTVILNAVDEKLQRERIITEQRIARLEKKIQEMEIRINQKIDRFTNSIDKFLKRLTLSQLSQLGQLGQLG